MTPGTPSARGRLPRSLVTVLAVGLAAGASCGDGDGDVRATAGADVLAVAGDEIVVGATTWEEGVLTAGEGGPALSVTMEGARPVDDRDDACAVEYRAIGRLDRGTVVVTVVSVRTVASVAAEVEAAGTAPCGGEAGQVYTLPVTFPDGVRPPDDLASAIDGVDHTVKPVRRDG